MEFKAIERKMCGEYLNRYDIHYNTPEGGVKVYEMFSRDPGINSEEKLTNPRTDAVIIIVTDKEHERLLLIREFRLELNRAIYGLPAGLIDPGETAEVCAIRELKEETGLDMCRVTHVMPASYCAVGISNEMAVCVFGEAEGEIVARNAEDEEIEAHWFTKAELREMLKTENFGSWAQAYCFMWTIGLDK